jgi:hypothetical protein
MDTPIAPIQIPRLPNTATAEEIFAATQLAGGCIVEQNLSPELLARLNAELDPHLIDRDPLHGMAGDEGMIAFCGRRTKRLNKIAVRAPSFADYALEPRLLEWVRLNLSPMCTEYQIGMAQVIEIGPGEPAQYLHRDEVLFPKLASTTDNQLLVNTMTALTDFDEENGATRVAPFTHTSPKRPAEEFDVERDTLPAIMKAGDTLFWLGSLVHGGGENKSANRFRRGLACQFSLGWLRSEEAHSLSMSIEQAKALPPRLRELLGFAAYRTGGGYSYSVDMADPYGVLFGEERPTPAPTGEGFF